MHCETQQHGLPRLLTEAQTLDAPMTEARIWRAMNLPSQSRRVNISNASPLWVSEIDGITFFPAIVTYRRTCCWSAYVAYWHKADIQLSSANVRQCPLLGEQRDIG
jgi:hypothetical protein